MGKMLINHADKEYLQQSKLKGVDMRKRMLRDISILAIVGGLLLANVPYCISADEIKPDNADFLSDLAAVETQEIDETSSEGEEDINHDVISVDENNDEFIGLLSDELESGSTMSGFDTEPAFDIEDDYSSIKNKRKLSADI